MRKRVLTWGGGILVVALLAAWGVGELTYPSNPPHRFDGTILSSESDPVLRQACFDCHSNESRRPWYRHVPVVGLLLGQHIREGRSKVNFSMWDTLDSHKQREAIGEALEAVREGDMPTPDYTLVHPEARLAPPQIAMLERDSLARYGVTGEGGRERGYEREGEGEREGGYDRD